MTACDFDEMPETEEDTLFRCTICGREGSVGRCCGRDTRNEKAKMDIARERVEAPQTWR
jgi:hypothetical protein